MFVSLSPEDLFEKWNLSINHENGIVNYEFKLISLVCFCCFMYLATAMVMAAWSVHLPTLFLTQWLQF